MRVLERDRPFLLFLCLVLALVLGLLGLCLFVCCVGLNIVSKVKVSIYRNIDLSIYGIECVLPSILWRPLFLYICADTERNL